MKVYKISAASYDGGIGINKWYNGCSYVTPSNDILVVRDTNMVNFNKHYSLYCTSIGVVVSLIGDK